MRSNYCSKCSSLSLKFHFSALSPSTLIRLYRLVGTFHSNGVVEMAVRGVCKFNNPNSTATKFLNSCQHGTLASMCSENTLNINDI